MLKLYDVDIQKALISNNFEDRKEIANCLLEQGYALLFEDYVNNEKKARLSLKEASKQLTEEVSNAKDDRNSVSKRGNQEA